MVEAPAFLVPTVTFRGCIWVDRPKDGMSEWMDRLMDRSLWLTNWLKPHPGLSHLDRVPQHGAGQILHCGRERGAEKGALYLLFLWCDFW